MTVWPFIYGEEMNEMMKQKAHESLHSMCSKLHQKPASASKIASSFNYVFFVEVFTSRHHQGSCSTNSKYAYLLRDLQHGNGVKVWFLNGL